MTTHLTPDECFQAADGNLATARLDHVATCEACRVSVDEARAFLARVASTDVPEPSPLFWDHFSARVRLATAREAAPSHGSWWLRVARPVVAMSATAAVAVLAVWMMRQPGVGPVTSGGPVVPGTLVEAPLESWESVMALTSGWSSDDLEGLAPGENDDALFIDEMSSVERAAFARVLREELAVMP